MFNFKLLRTQKKSFGSDSKIATWFVGFHFHFILLVQSAISDNTVRPLDAFFWGNEKAHAAQNQVII